MRRSAMVDRGVLGEGQWEIGALSHDIPPKELILGTLKTGLFA